MVANQYFYWFSHLQKIFSSFYFFPILSQGLSEFHDAYTMQNIKTKFSFPFYYELSSICYFLFGIMQHICTPVSNATCYKTCFCSHKSRKCFLLNIKDEKRCPVDLFFVILPRQLLRYYIIYISLLLNPWIRLFPPLPKGLADYVYLPR